LVGGNTPHCWLTERGDSSPVHARVIQFLPESIGPALAQTATFRPLARLFERAQRGLLISGPSHDHAARVMRELFTERTRSLDRYVGLLGILTELSESEHCKELALLDALPPLDAAAAQLAGRLLTYIHQHVADSDLGFNQVARAAGMSRASLGRVFPKLFGRTFAKYLAEARVVKACTLLSDTDKSVAEIANETGFGSVSNFNRRFLALKRTSPLRYRKAAR
jgi:transcriptional regulator GlxA family with amidase domain